MQERKKLSEFNDQMKQGDALAKKNVDQAKAAYAKALQILEQNQQIIQPKAYEQLKALAQRKIDTLNREKTHLVEIHIIPKTLRPAAGLP